MLGSARVTGVWSGCGAAPSPARGLAFIRCSKLRDVSLGGPTGIRRRLPCICVADGQMIFGVGQVQTQ